MNGVTSRVTLFRQFATMLMVVVLGFAAASGGIVMVLYARDQPQLARDLLRQQAERLVEAGDRAGTLSPPDGATWRWEILNDQGRRLRSGGDAALSVPDARDRMESQRFAHLGPGVRMSGVTAIPGRDTTLWVSLSMQSPDKSVFASALLLELGEHVLLPLGPLVILLLAVGLWQVRRITRPLHTAAWEADALDPARPESRLTIPDGPIEAEVLVRAFNRALSRIETSGRFIREFNAHAAHEMRTPLAVMSLSVDRLPAGELRDRLSSDIGGLKRVVGQMLDLAQADALEASPFETFDLGAVASDVVAQLAPLAWDQQRDIALARDSEVVVTGHREAIARAVRNLLENALRHTPSGDTVEVTTGPGPRLAVRDHGPGVDDAHKEVIFERFWRGDRSRLIGAGLGLGIVQATMQAHGGRVWVEDAEGGGARFVLEFPHADGAPGAATRARGPSDSSG